MLNDHGTCMQYLQMLPPDGPNAIDLAVAYAQGSEAEQNFVQDIALFLATFLKEHGKNLEVVRSPGLQPVCSCCG